MREYKRYKIYPLAEVSPHILTSYDADNLQKQTKNQKEFKTLLYTKFDDVYVKMVNRKYEIFLKDRFKCVECNKIAAYAALEKLYINGEESSGYHFNFYVIDDKGREIMLTRDHVKPKCLGGADTKTNQQTMCERCNKKKGGKMGYHRIDIFDLAICANKLYTGYLLYWMDLYTIKH